MSDTVTRTDRPRRGILARVAGQREYGILAILALTIGTVSVINPAFLSPANLRDMLVNCAPVVILACGMTLVIATREIDISIGSNMGLLAVAMGILASPERLGLPVVWSVLLVLLLGTLVGAVNGLLVTVGRGPSIIVTLAMLTVLRGATDVLLDGKWITNLPFGLRVLGTGGIGGIPYSVLAAVVIAIATAVFLRSTAPGRRVLAIGDNPDAARLAGLPATPLKIGVFAILGLLTAVATLVSVTQLSVIESGIGVGMEMLVITCVVVGGTSINGGKATLIGAVLGVLLLGTVRTELVFMKLGEMSTYWERAIQGGFILLAVLVDHLAVRRKRKRGGVR